MPKKTIFVPLCACIEENPANNVEYQRNLRLQMTLAQAISRRIWELFCEPADKHREHEVELPDNSKLAPKAYLDGANDWLKLHLDEIVELNGGKPPIVFIRDKCFTNDLLMNVLKYDFAEDTPKYVKEIHVSFEKGEGEDYLTGTEIVEEIGNNSIVILGGSRSDTYSMNGKFYDSPLGKLFQQTTSDDVPRENNIRIVAICFGSQLLANLLCIDNPEKDKLTMTIRGDARFGPTPCIIENLGHVNPVYRDALAGLTNDPWFLWQLVGVKGGFKDHEKMMNTSFTAASTHTGHVHFDFLKRGGPDNIVPLVRDGISGNVIGWGTKNGRAIGIQVHPEIDLNSDRDAVMAELIEIMPYLKEKYGEDAEKILSNFDLGDASIASIARHFYIPTLLSFAKSILRENTGNYQNLTHKVRCEIRERVGHLLQLNHMGHLASNIENRGLTLEDIDKAWMLYFVASLDWKVNRWIKESSEILGLKDLAEFARSHFKFLESYGYKRPFIFCDKWPGNGTLLREMYKALPWEDIVFYGIADRIYFDIYQGIKRSKFSEWIPENIIRLFVQKFLAEYKRAHMHTRETLREKFASIMDVVTIHPDDKVHVSSMFLDKTEMFSHEEICELNDEDKAFLESKDYDFLERLKGDLRDNLYDYFYGYFERIYLSDFNDFNPESDVFSHGTFEVAIRSTSHVNHGNFREIVRNFIEKFSDPGAISVDNGVFRSYTNVPRIPELYSVQQEFGKRVRIDLVYDTETNYICSALIQCLPFREREDLASQLSKWKILIPIEEAYHSTFFQFEYFLRNFIVANFKDYTIFWDFRREIMQAIREAIAPIESKNAPEVKRIIAELINKMVEKINKIHGPYYSEISEKAIDSSLLDELFSMHTCTPSWQRTYAKRREERLRDEENS